MRNVYPLFISRWRLRDTRSYAYCYSSPGVLYHRVPVTVWFRRDWVVVEWLGAGPLVQDGKSFMRRATWDRLSEFERSEAVGKFVEGLGSGGKGVPKTQGKPSATDEKAYPALTDMLFTSAFKDGALRETTTVLFLVDAGRLKACVSDRELGQVAFVSLESLGGAFAALETALQEGDLDWREKREYKPRK